MQDIKSNLEELKNMLVSLNGIKKKNFFSQINLEIQDFHLPPTNINGLHSEGFFDINTKLFHAFENNVDEPREFVYRLVDTEENITKNHREEILQYCLATVLPTDSVGLGDIFVHGKFVELIK